MSERRPPPSPPPPPDDEWEGSDESWVGGDEDDPVLSDDVEALASPRCDVCGMRARWRRAIVTRRDGTARRVWLVDGSSCEPHTADTRYYEAQVYSWFHGRPYRLVVLASQTTWLPEWADTVTMEPAADWEPSEVRDA